MNGSGITHGTRGGVNPCSPLTLLVVGAEHYQRDAIDCVSSYLLAHLSDVHHNVTDIIQVFLQSRDMTLHTKSAQKHIM